MRYHRLLERRGFHVALVYSRQSPKLSQVFLNMQRNASKRQRVGWGHIRIEKWCVMKRRTRSTPFLFEFALKDLATLLLHMPPPLTLTRTLASAGDSFLPPDKSSKQGVQSVRTCVGAVAQGFGCTMVSVLVRWMAFQGQLANLCRCQRQVGRDGAAQTRLGSPAKTQPLQQSI